MAVLNDFESNKLSELGYSIREVEDDYTIIYSIDRNSEIIIWKLGDWLQFRCMAFPLASESSLGSRQRVMDAINKIHEIAIGARIIFHENDGIILIMDMLHSVVTNEIVAKMADQLLFLSDRIYQPLTEAFRDGRVISDPDVDEMFS